MAELPDRIRFEVITPSRVLIQQDVHLVVIPGGDGNFGVLPGHAPLLSTVRPGTVEIYDADMKVVERIFVEGGFAEVNPERCTLLAEQAMDVREITRDRADTRLQQADQALLAAEDPGVRIGAERELKAAEAMCEAVDACEREGVRR